MQPDGKKKMTNTRPSLFPRVWVDRTQKRVEESLGCSTGTEITPGGVVEALPQHDNGILTPQLEKDPPREKPSTKGKPGLDHHSQT